MSVSAFFNYRYERFHKRYKQLEEQEGGLERFSRGYDRFGLNRTKEGGIVYREWAPGAQAVYLTGDFSKSALTKFLFLNIQELFVVRWMG